MNRLFILLFLLLLLVGCSKNEVTLINSSSQTVTTHFRGERIVLAPTGTHLIDDIPDGNFTYEAVATIPAGIDSVDAVNMSGSFSFSDLSTKTSLEFVSRIDTVTEDTVSVVIYRINAVKSSSKSSAGF